MKRLLLALLLLMSPVYAEQVCSVHDGDTFRLCSGQSIRVWGIDAPELKQPYGYQSRDYLRGLINGKEVVLNCNGRSYKRKVCQVRRDDGVDIERAMVGHGFAYDSAKYSHGLYQRDERTAQQHKTGVWNGQAQIKPWEWRKLERAGKRSTL